MIPWVLSDSTVGSGMRLVVGLHVANPHGPGILVDNPAMPPIRLSRLNRGRLRGEGFSVMRALGGAAALAFVLVVATGEASAQAPDATRVPEVYRIGPEDTLLITV